MQKRKNNKNLRKKKQNNSAKSNYGVNRFDNQAEAIWKLPRTVSNILPDKLRTRLTYNGMTNFVISTGTQVFARRWTPTAAFDIDPLLGSTTTVGFAEMSLLYNYYRVHASTLRVVASPAAPEPFMVVLVPLNADPGTSPSVATVQAYINNPYCKSNLLGCVGARPLTLSQTMTTQKIFGDPMVKFDDNFQSLVNNVPVNNWYWAVAVLTPGATASNLFATLEVDIEIDCDFYGRKFLNN